MGIMDLFRHFTDKQEKNRQARVDENTEKKLEEIKKAGVSIIETSDRIKNLTDPLINKKKHDQAG